MIEKLKDKLTEEEVNELNSFVENKAQNIEEEIEREIQRAEDRVRQSLYKEKIKPLQDEINKLKPKEMSKEEVRLQELQKELEQKEEMIKKQEIDYKLKETLIINNIPLDLAKYVSVKSEEDIETITQEIGSILSKHLEKHSYQPDNHNRSNATITKEDFVNMNYIEKLELLETDESLYKVLSNID